MKVQISDIRISDDRRKADYHEVLNLANSIKLVGLINPITIKHDGEIGKYLLVAGMHRLKAHVLLGEQEIKANIVSGTNLEIELIEIDENLIRNELKQADIDDLTYRRKEIYEEMYPQTKHNATFKGNQFRSESESDLEQKPSFVKDTSNKTGKSETIIKEEILRARNLIPEAKELFREDTLNKTDATILAREEPEQQRKVINLITTGQAKKVDEAKRILSPEEEWLKKEYKQIDKEHNNHRLVANLINETKFLKIDEKSVEDYLSIVAVESFKTDFVKNCDRLIDKLNDMKAYYSNLNKLRRIK